MACVAAGVLGVIVAFVVPLPERLGQPNSAVVTWRDGMPAHVFLAPDDRWRVAVEVEEIDPNYIKALLALEDQRFWWHPGVDPVAIARASWSNLSAGKVVSGASTLTMQLVRMVEPRPRTLWSKGIEALRAMQLEVRMSKPEILGHYLRFVPYGRNIEGVDAAALTYFGHRSDALSAHEIATLLAVPQAPNTRYPSFRNKGRLKTGRDAVAKELITLGALAGDELGALGKVEAMEVPAELHPFPREIPHAAIWLRGKFPGRERLETTLDAQMTRAAVRLLEEGKGMLWEDRIFNGSVVVTDHAKQEVRVLVGNVDFFDGQHAGQLPGFTIARSTGSLLKPLLLGLAIDQGIAHPDMLLPDVPVVRGRWHPQNFTGTFEGLVSVRDALSRSLNIPFVLMAEHLGTPNLTHALHKAGFAHLSKDPEHDGLGVVIGGVEATPLEIAGLYGAMAHGGRFGQPILLKDLKKESPIPLISPASAHLVQQTLMERSRPDRPWRESDGSKQIAWKTGTSNDHRDAWSAGSVGDLTAVIWLGNFSAVPSLALVGQRRASPFMFDLFEDISPLRTRDPLPAPKDLVSVSVCTFSGMRPTTSCPHTREVMAPKASVAMEECPYHDTVEVEAHTGMRVHSSCRAGRVTKMQSVMSFDPLVAKHLNTSGQAELMPPWAKGCEPLGAEGGGKLRVTQPRQGDIVLLIPGLRTSEQKVPFRVQAGPNSGELHWFLDGAFLGSTPPEEAYWWVPTEGTHELVVMNTAGDSVKRAFEVQGR